MHEITLEWLEASQVRVSKQVIGLKHPSSIKLGRNPDLCDIVFTQQDPTISRQHAEIFYNDDDNMLYLRKLPEGLRPPTVDSKMIYSDPAPLHLGSTIVLGETEIKVTSLITTPQDGLICSNVKCRNPHPKNVVDRKHLFSGCPWCGVSLADAITFYPN